MQDFADLACRLIHDVGISKLTSLPLSLEGLDAVIEIGVWICISVEYISGRGSQLTRNNVLDLERRPIERIIGIAEEMGPNGGSVDGCL